MTIQNLIINGKTFRKQDFLDLILNLQDPLVNDITVVYKDDSNITSTKQTSYKKINNQWFRTLDKGIESNTRIRVVKNGRFHIIENI